MRLIEWARSLPKFRSIGALLAIATIVTLFQNCGGYRSTDFVTAQSLSSEALGLPQCAFNGQVLAKGISITAYKNGGGVCDSETRTCGDNGVLSGSFAYAACVPSQQTTPSGDTTPRASCLFNGRTIASGDTVTAFVTNVADTSCVSEQRACTNGVLAGTFAHDQCVVAGPAACVFNGQIVPAGQSVNAFARARVPAGQSCVPQVRTCATGALSGAGEFASCVVGGRAPCLFNGQTLADGQSVTAFASSVGACAPVTRTCADGTLTGAGDFASCRGDGPASCLFNGRTITSGDAVRAYTTAASNVGSACAVESRLCGAGQLTGSAAESSCLPRAEFISAEYVRPLTKQGLADARRDDDPATLDARYARFKTMGIGLKIYNYWWGEVESAGISPSDRPVACPAGHVMVPADEAERVRWGFHHFRCLNQAHISKFDQLFTHDAANGIQSTVVIWSAPKSYRHPGCSGNSWSGSTLFDGCVPRDDAMDDFEDIITFLGQRHNGRNGFGKISHFVVWNENASGLWFDYSPVVPNRGNLSASQQDQWISKYAAMMIRAHDAVQRTSGGVMIDASTDLIWGPPRVKANEAAHIGSGILLNGLWQKLGVKYSWSVAVHPYGDVDKAASPGTYNFNNVQDLVSSNQITQLARRGLPSDSFQYPQAFLFASEQGWPQSEGINKQATNICQAHAVTLGSGYLISQTHNYFQSVEPQESAGGSSGQGAFYGLLPNRSAVDLSDIANYATGLAYLATAPTVWGQSSAHFCCQSAGVGCLQPPGTQPVFRSLGRYHFFSLFFGEGPRAGLRPEMTAFNLFTSPGEDRAPLFRCRGPSGDALISNRADCEGYVNEGLLGYARTTPAGGLVKIYRKLNPLSGDHLATLNATEGAPAYVDEPALGWVPPL